MAHLWDTVLRKVAERFISSLPPEEEAHCRQVILDDLCREPDRRSPLESFPNRPGTIECFIKGWHFRYSIENSNTITVYTIYYSPDNPKSPLYGWFPTGPRPPQIS